MEHEGGYDFDVVTQDLATDFQCVICNLLLRDAVETACEHPFCKICLETWEHGKRQQKQAPFCPICNQPYDSTKSRPAGTINRFVRSRLDVKCKQSRAGCEWKGKIDSYQLHEDVCSLFNVKCKNVGCDVEIQRKDLQLHLKHCQHCLVKCEWCDEEVTSFHLERHYESCLLFPILCTNEGCGLTFERRDLQSHQENHCGFQLVSCEFVSAGCNEMVLRNEQERHSHTFTQKHMSLMMALIVEKDKKLEEVKTKLEEKDEQLQQNVSSAIQMSALLLTQRFEVEGFEKNVQMLDANNYQEKKNADQIQINQQIALLKEEFEFSEVLILQEALDQLIARNDQYLNRFSKVCKSMEASKYYLCDKNKTFYFKLHMDQNWIRKELYVNLVDNVTLIKNKADKLCKHRGDNNCIRVCDNWIKIFILKDSLGDAGFEGCLMNPNCNADMSNNRGIGWFQVAGFCKQYLCQSSVIFRFKMNS